MYVISMQRKGLIGRYLVILLHTVNKKSGFELEKFVATTQIFSIPYKLMTSVFCLSAETGRCKEKWLWVVVLPAKRT